MTVKFLLCIRCRLDKQQPHSVRSGNLLATLLSHRCTLYLPLPEAHTSLAMFSNQDLHPLSISLHRLTNGLDPPPLPMLKRTHCMAMLSTADQDHLLNRHGLQPSAPAALPLAMLDHVGAHHNRDPGRRPLFNLSVKPKPNHLHLPLALHPSPLLAR